ncbi:MAG: hypothetical protein U0Q15_14295 [Kineosporiaceae bacterium]
MIYVLINVVTVLGLSTALVMAVTADLRAQPRLATGTARARHRERNVGWVVGLVAALFLGALGLVLRFLALI